MKNNKKLKFILYETIAIVWSLLLAVPIGFTGTLMMNGKITKVCYILIAFVYIPLWYFITKKVVIKLERRLLWKKK